MGLKKTFVRTDPQNKSGLDLSYHIIGQIIIDKKSTRIICRILSFLDKKQREINILGGFEVIPPFVFSEKDCLEILKSKNLIDACYLHVKKSNKKEKHEMNFLASASDD